MFEFRGIDEVYRERAEPGFVALAAAFLAGLDVPPPLPHSTTVCRTATR